MNIYDEAILVQDACNPSGVAHFLLKCFKHIRNVEKVTDTEAICRHPLFVLVVNKLDSLTRSCKGTLVGSDMAFATAYGACKFRAEGFPSEDHDSLRSKALPGHPSSVMNIRYKIDDDFIEICEDIGRGRPAGGAGSDFNRNKSK